MPSINDICNHCDQDNVPDACEALLEILSCTFPFCIAEDIDDETRQWRFKSGDNEVIVTQHMNEDRFSVYADCDNRESDEEAMAAGYQFLGVC